MCPLGGDSARMIQVGVVSWGLECGQAVPGVYADLMRPEANTWLVNNVNNLQTTLGSYSAPRSLNTGGGSNTISASAWGK